MASMTYLVFNPLSVPWKLAFWGEESDDRVLAKASLPCCYLFGMVGYAFSIVRRTVSVAEMILRLGVDLVSEGELNKELQWHVLKAWGYFLVVPIGIICPPAGYALDEMVHGSGSCCHDCTCRVSDSTISREFNPLPTERQEVDSFQDDFNAALTMLKKVCAQQHRESDLSDIGDMMGDTFLWICRVATLKLAIGNQLLAFTNSLGLDYASYWDDVAQIRGELSRQRQGLDLDALVSEMISDSEGTELSQLCKKFGGRLMTEQRTRLAQLAEAAYEAAYKAEQS